MKTYSLFGELFNVPYNQKFEGRAVYETVHIDFDDLKRQLAEQGVNVRLLETSEGGSPPKDAVRVEQP